MKPTPYRTVLLVVLGLLVLLGGFYWSVHGNGTEGLYAILRDGVFLLVATGASKSAVEHLAGGGGLKGAAKVLFTDAKPGAPAEPAP